MGETSERRKHDKLSEDIVRREKEEWPSLKSCLKRTKNFKRKVEADIE